MKIKTYTLGEVDVAVWEFVKQWRAQKVLY